MKIYIALGLSVALMTSATPVFACSKSEKAKIIAIIDYRFEMRARQQMAFPFKSIRDHGYRILELGETAKQAVYIGNKRDFYTATTKGMLLNYEFGNRNADKFFGFMAPLVGPAAVVGALGNRADISWSKATFACGLVDGKISRSFACSEYESWIKAYMSTPPEIARDVTVCDTAWRLFKAEH